MKRNNLFPVAEKGWKYITSVLALFLLALLIDSELLSFILFILFVALLYIFRNPERQLPLFEKSSVLSPSDGVVRSIVELKDSEYAYRVDIESSLVDVAILRSPVNAKVQKVLKYNGTRVSKESKLFMDTNENVILIFTDEDKNSLKVTHTLKQSFIPLSVDLLPAQNIHQTTRYGFMINGVTSIYLPANFRVNVNIGEELNASESLIGYFS